MAKRWNLMPIENVELFKKYKELEASIWTSNELDYVSDRDAYNQLPENEKRLFKNIFRFFAPSDGAVSQNLAYRFILESKTYEDQAFFIAQLANELVHSETYSLIIRTIFTNEADYKDVMEAIDNIDCIKRKGVFMDKYINDIDVSPPVRYFAFCIVERLMFMVLFSAIFYFKKYGQLKNTILANKLISRDETIHNVAGSIQFKNTCKIYGTPDAKLLRDMLDEAIDIERDFIKEMIGDNEIGELNKHSLEVFAKSLANDIIVICGLQDYNIFYNGEDGKLVKNTITYVEGTWLDTKSNFFESRGSEYNRFDPTKAFEKFMNPGKVEKKIDLVADNNDIDF
jgi:ribonucleotide reductase beta subunit family protein with ferritin-like domain